MSHIGALQLERSCGWLRLERCSIELLSGPGPPSVNFGEVCARSSCERELSIVNNLEQFVHVVIEVRSRVVRLSFSHHYCSVIIIVIIIIIIILLFFTLGIYSRGRFKN